MYPQRLPEPSTYHNGTHGRSSTNQKDKILQKYLPQEVTEVLDSKSKVVHGHRILILNFSCGQSVINKTSRDMLLAG